MLVLRRGDVALRGRRAHFRCAVSQPGVILGAIALRSRSSLARAAAVPLRRPRCTWPTPRDGQFALVGAHLIFGRGRNVFWGMQGARLALLTPEADALLRYLPTIGTIRRGAGSQKLPIATNERKCVRRIAPVGLPV